MGREIESRQGIGWLLFLEYKNTLVDMSQLPTYIKAHQRFTARVIKIINDTVG
jgi:hypothetical protein